MCSLNNPPCFRSLNQSAACPIAVGNSICGETNSLEITKEFNRLYEDRIQQVDSEAGGDCLQEKIKLQQEWIRNLTQQNEMLVRAVQELEYEATERVKQLEEKLHKSAQCLCEVMKKYREHDFTTDLLAKPLQKILHLEDDIRNVLEFIRRVRENGQWSTDGLFFYKITNQDLLGSGCNDFNKCTTNDFKEGEELLDQKERTVQELTQKLNYYNSFGNVECLVDELKCRREECESLKHAMKDMRQALTEEVASKHDQITLLKKEVLILEEQCTQAHKQIAFKDDVIKELRNDTRQLKHQFTQEEMAKLTSTIEELQINLERTKIAQDEEEKEHKKEISQLNSTINSLEQELNNSHNKNSKDAKICKVCRGKSKVGFLESTEVQANLGRKEVDVVEALNEAKTKMNVEIEKRDGEIHTLKFKVNELESALNLCEERASNLQEAVTLYSNSLKVLEQAEQEANKQILQQKATISNLQQALVAAKQEIDEMQRKSQDNVSGKSWAAWFGITSSSDLTNNPSKLAGSSNNLVHDI